MRYLRPFLLLVLVAFPASVARADYLEVRRSSTIKAQPSGDGAVISRPEVGAFLILIEDSQTNGYYHVRATTSGIQGWIYRTLVRRFHGDPPGGTHSPTEAPGIVDIYWWNIRDLSAASRDATEIAQIASVLHNAEVIAIGELNDTVALGLLASQLGSTWRFAQSPKVGRTPNTAEHYGFLWNSSVIGMVGTVHVDDVTKDTIDREPAWATFRTTDNRLDFTVIAIHVTWGSTVGPRQAEIRLLDDVWGRVQAGTPDDDDLILVGDFNRNIGDESFDELLSIPGMVRANEDSPATHIYSPSTYDQVLLSTDFTSEWTGGFTTHLFDDDAFGGNDAAASKACSDHRPVSISLLTPGADDDG